MNSIISLPKAELHVHLEAALTPNMARRLAARHKITLPDDIFYNDEQFACTDYHDFMQAYDIVAQVVRTPEDYKDVTYDYLCRSHKLGSVYTELTISPGHAFDVGLAYEDMLAGVVEGIGDAHKENGIESRIIIVFVRHHGSEYIGRIEKEIIKHLHPYVVGIGLAGLESSTPAKAFTRAFTMAREAGLHCTAHAGEALGPESIWDVLEHLPVERIGHGVRSVEDPKLLAVLYEKNIALELCITSNIVTGTYTAYRQHPFLQLYKSGISVSLNSDDPTFFGTSIAKEYEIARDIFGISEQQLLHITRDAISHSFAQKKLKDQLLKILPI